MPNFYYCSLDFCCFLISINFSFPYWVVFPAGALGFLASSSPGLVCSWEYNNNNDYSNINNDTDNNNSNDDDNNCQGLAWKFHIILSGSLEVGNRF